MKKINLYLFFIVGLIFSLKAQPYGNEWIDFNKTYYKFKVLNKKICRIDYNTLVNAGISNNLLVGNYFKLFKNGKEVPIYVTTTGQFDNTSFIEFLGDGNDGTFDTNLYKDPNFQPHTAKSLFQDSAVYFLTIDENGPNLRLTPEANDLTAPPTKELFGYRTLSKFVSTIVNGNNAYPQSTNYTDVFESDFGNGEGYGGNLGGGFSQATSFLYNADTLLTAHVKLNYYTSSHVNHNALIKIGNTFSLNDIFYGKSVRKIDVIVPVKKLTNNNTNISVSPTLTGEGAYSSLYSEITYPATFNASNASVYEFGIDKTDNVYIEIPSFNSQSSNPIVYDLSNNKRYEINNEAILKINLVATTFPKNNIYISAQNSTSINIINNLKAIQFENYSDVNKQGNYIILTNSKAITSSDSINHVELYKQYRNSIAGGAYNTQIYMIQQLDDQFAYGITHHPLAIRNFINFALDHFSEKPEHLFIIGRGRDYKNLRNNTNDYIQTYGFPPSDMLLTARSAIQNTPQIGVGRLDVTDGIQIRDYLEKVKEYEADLNDTIPSAQTPLNKLWRKNMIHLGGGYSEMEQLIFKSYLDGYKSTAEAPKYGAKVFSFFKNSSSPLQIAETALVDSLVTNGVSLITFFGHSTTSNVDFNLNPDILHNKSKYNMMFTNGCFVGNLFSGLYGYSHRFVLSPNKGAIGFLGPYDLAYSNILNNYAIQFYNKLCLDNYNAPIGTILKETAKQVIGQPYTPLDPSMAEQMLYHGDPAVRLNTFSKPDYYIDPSSISFNPTTPSISNDSFAINIVVKNLGYAVPNCEYAVRVIRNLPSGIAENYTINIPCTVLNDTVTVYIKNNKTSVSGVNNFSIKIDADDMIDEYSELNNEVSITQVVTSDDIIPIYPYEFCIVNDPNFILKFSTADNFIGNRQYIFQIDTTEYFNSPLLVSEHINAPGAVIDWKPNIQLLQDKVYYWRGALDTIYNNTLQWNGSSFIYNTSLTPGWNQSHYFQYKKDQFNTIELPEATRIFQYPNILRSLRIKNGNISDQAIEAYFDEFLVARNSCARASMIFFVFDINTGKPWGTYKTGNGNIGPYGDNVCVGRGYTVNVIEFPTAANTPTGFNYRQKCINFLNSIPNNAFVMGYSFRNAGYTNWDGDILQGGSSLFDAFENLGVSQIRNQENNVPFVFFLQKGNPNYTPIQIKRYANEGIIDTTFFFTGNWVNGTMQSTIIGPAKEWTDLQFKWNGLEAPTYDQSLVNIVGIDSAGIRNNLFYNIADPIKNINNIDAKRYPLLQLEWLTSDKINATAPQLNYWRITYAKPPEAVINPSLHFTKSSDTILFGKNFQTSIAFQNITPIDMDSVLVKFTIINAANFAQTFYQRFAKLPGNQHIIINFDHKFDNLINTGLNKIIIEANPDNDQIEQFHFNNFAEFFVYVVGDNINPLLDITFDGKHITDGEYISAKPEILFRLKDENKNLALNDTSAFLIYMYYPNNPTVPVLISNSNPDVVFIPADSSNLEKINEAKLIFKPTLPDGTYEIRVQGIDRSNNDAGKYEYRIKFKVDSKPSISNVLNYPNPFSTSTQFVFTITGSEVPNNILIQIFSQSGKVVKEITQAELGTLHIGTNITDYKWNATDNYGDRLANGVYFYRVLVKDPSGKNIEIKSSSADKYFKNGYGKMYIIK